MLRFELRLASLAICTQLFRKERSNARLTKDEYYMVNGKWTVYIVPFFSLETTQGAFYTYTE